MRMVDLWKLCITTFSMPDITNAKVLLFARWMTTQYGTPEYDVNGYDGTWWKEQLEHFNEVVWPNYIENGSVKNTLEFLSNN